MGCETMRRETVLIVDDEPQVLTALSDVLEDDYAVMTCNSAAEALAQLAGGRKVACILSDQRMPGMTGDSFLTEACNICDAPRILITGYADLNAVIRAVNDGKIYGYVAKPWEPVALRQLLRSAVDHYKMGEALAQERALLKNLMESLPDAVYFKDQNHRYVRVNPVKAKALGLGDGREAIGKTSASFSNASRAWEVEKEEGWIFKTGKPVTDKVEEVAQAEGGPQWRSTTKAPVRDAAGEVVGLVCVARDVTSRVLGQQRLAESERRFRSFYNHTPAMLQTVDARGRLIYVSDYWCEVMGYSRAEVIGRFMVEFQATSDRKGTEQALLGRLMREGTIINSDCRLIAKGGHVLETVLSAVAERNDRMELVQALCVLTDITEKKALEQQLVQSQKMEAIGQLTGGIAHDFNNLLTVIVGNLDVAVGRCEDETRELLLTALKAGEKGAGLTQRLLAYARRQLLTPSSFFLSDLVESLEDLLRRTLGELIRIETRHAPGTWPIRADREQLEHALINLALNARDAMPEGGTIRIETENAPEADGAEAFVTLTVSDTGRGMSAEVKARAAEPFFTTKEIGEGSGLGLSTVEGFMRQSKGRLKIESEPGRGTTVRLYLPRAVEAPDLRPAEIQDCPRGSETILLVEDNAPVRVFAAEQLRRLGYEVLEAADGRSAQEFLKSNAPIDLLFSDVVIAGARDGYALAAEARRQRPALRVLLTSGYAGRSDAGGLAPDRGLLAKPYRLKDLALSVRDALDPVL